MIRLDHLTLPVQQYTRSRDWYVTTLGLKVEFEVAERSTVALQDDGGFTLFLVERREEQFAPACTLAFQVNDVDAKHRELSARGVAFEKEPQVIDFCEKHN